MTSTSEAQTRAQMQAATIERPTEFALLGRRWDLLPGVFSPQEFASTAFFAGVVPYPVGGALLEMGCGAGVLAVTAALSGAAHVTAADVNGQAVRNAELNAARHGVADRVLAVESDLFDAVPEQPHFDVIFWNSNFVPMPAGYAYRSLQERAFFDPGYACHARYLEHAPRWLAPGGRLFLGFSTLGDRPALERLAARSALTVHERAHVRSAESTPTDYFLLELVPRTDRGTGDHITPPEGH